MKFLFLLTDFSKEYKNRDVCLNFHIAWRKNQENQPQKNDLTIFFPAAALPFREVWSRSTDSVCIPGNSRLLWHTFERLSLKPKEFKIDLFKLICTPAWMGLMLHCLKRGNEQVLVLRFCSQSSCPLVSASLLPFFTFPWPRQPWHHHRTQPRLFLSCKVSFT